MMSSLEPAFQPPAWAWILLFGGAALAIAIDLRAPKLPKAKTLGRAWTKTLLWMGAAAAVAAALWIGAGRQQAQQYLAGYLIELSLSVDNVFLFLIIFRQLNVAETQQHRVLFWGVLGAAIVRTTFIVLGIALIEHAHWLIEAFGLLLVATGIRLFATRNKRHLGKKSPTSLATRLSGWLSADTAPHPTRFFVRTGGRMRVTTLLIALIAIEAADFVFALDSLPADLGVTHTAFTAVASNLLAILGLRSLYVIVGGSVGRFRHLGISLAGVLVFVGLKMLCAPWISLSPTLSLAIIAALLAAGIVASLARPAAPSPLS